MKPIIHPTDAICPLLLEKTTMVVVQTEKMTEWRSFYECTMKTIQQRNNWDTRANLYNVQIRQATLNSDDLNTIVLVLFELIVNIFHTLIWCFQPQKRRLLYVNFVSTNLTKWSNTLKQFVGFCRRIFWVWSFCGVGA